MTAPVIEAGDVTESGSNAAERPWELDYPAYADGDLIICIINGDEDHTHTWDSTGPNGETVVTIQKENNAGGSNGPTVSSMYWIGDGSHATGTFDVTAGPSTPWDKFAGAVIKVLAGEFDATTPIDSYGEDGSTSTSSPPSPAWTGTAADGTVVAWIGVDQDPISGTPTGWTDIVNTDWGKCSVVLSIRDDATTASESIASVTWTIAGDSCSTVGFVVNAPAAAEITIDAAIGGYSQTGLAANLKHARLLNAEIGNYSLSGLDASLKYARILNAEIDNYSLSGLDASLKYARILNAEIDNYSLSGLDASLIFGEMTFLDAEGDSYSLTGETASLKHHRVLNAESTTYGITGLPVVFIRDSISLISEIGSYGQTGLGATLKQHRVLNAEIGIYTYAGRRIPDLEVANRMMVDLLIYPIMSNLTRGVTMTGKSD